MPEITGEVERIETKTANKGDKFKAVTLKGRTKVFYDWNNHCAAAEIAAGL